MVKVHGDPFHHVDYNAMLLAIKGDGIVSGLTVAEKGAGANMSVDVAAGLCVVDNTRYRETSITNLAIDASESGKHRKDTIIYDTSAGNPAVIKGTSVVTTSAAAPPDVTAGDILLAVVYIGDSVTSITDSVIYGGLVPVPARITDASSPTAADDTTLGYSIGDRWVNTTADQEFVCLDATTSAAVWIETTSQLQDDFLEIIRQMHPNVSVLAAMDDGSISSTVFDSYSESNYDTDKKIYWGSQWFRGQAFTNVSDRSLKSVKFYIKKLGSPPGNTYAQLYACDGTPGTDGKGTGTVPLASTPQISANSLTTSYQLIEFEFSEPYLLSASTNYVIILRYGDGNGDTDNCVIVGSDGSSPSHAGNATYYDDYNNWYSENSLDTCFYCYELDFIKYSTKYVLAASKIISDVLTDALAANAAVLSFFSHLKGKFSNGDSTASDPVEVEIYGNGDSYASPLNGATKLNIDPFDPIIELYRIDDSVVAKSDAQTDWVLDDNSTNGAFPAKTTSTHETILAEEIGCAAVVMVEKSVNGGFTDTELLVEDDDYTIDYSTRTATKIILTTSAAADIVNTQSKLRITWIVDVENIDGTANTALKMKIYLNRTDTTEASPEIQLIDLGTSQYAEMKYMCG